MCRMSSYSVRKTWPGAKLPTHFTRPEDISSKWRHPGLKDVAQATLRTFHLKFALKSHTHTFTHVHMHTHMHTHTLESSVNSFFLQDSSGLGMKTWPESHFWKWWVKLVASSSVVLLPLRDDTCVPWRKLLVWSPLPRLFSLTCIFVTLKREFRLF